MTPDTLTGVLNARAYYASCDAAIAAAKQHHTDYAVLFVDLDHFKSINDNYGHAAGDIVLKTVAKALNDHIRSQDMLAHQQVAQQDEPSAFDQRYCEH